MTLELNGLHHVSALSARIGENAAFWTGVMGLRLVKKSVNQDDTSSYHLFYADKVGSPGTDMTFFDLPYIKPERRGTDAIVATTFRVNGREALDYWEKRLTDHGVTHHGVEAFGGLSLLRFEDPEGQRIWLVDDKGASYEGEIWDEAVVPVEYALRGFYSALLSIPSLDQIEPILEQLLGWRRIEDLPGPDGLAIMRYTMAEGGPGREVWVVEQPDVPITQPGAGGVHHVAFRVKDFDEQKWWHDRISSTGLPISGLIDRFYFRSIYFRISRGILFEIATDGPGFDADEDLESLGESLALPPFLEPRREQIEAGLKPIMVG